MAGSEPLLSVGPIDATLDPTNCKLRLPQREFDALRVIASELRVLRGEAAFYEGDHDDGLCMATSGAIRLTKLMTDGRYQIVGFGFPGDFLGVSINGRRIYTAESIIDCTILKITKNKLSNLILENPFLRHYFLRLAYNDLREAQDQMVILGRKSAIERVTSFLLSLQDRIGSVEDGRRIIRLPMRREDIAAYSGLSVETVSRVFTDLRERRIISLITSTIIRIEKPDALRRLAGDACF